MMKTHNFEIGLGNRFLIWFLDTQKIEVRHGESRVGMLDHPYTSEQTRVLDLWQCGDVLFVNHPDHPLMALAHFSDGDWRWREASQIVPVAPIINVPDWLAARGYGMPPERKKDDPYEVLELIKSDDGGSTLAAGFTPRNGIRIGIVCAEIDDGYWREFDFNEDQAKKIGTALVRWAVRSRTETARMRGRTS